MADTATLVYDIDSRAARTAASDLAKLNDASARAAGGADKLNKTLRDSQGRFRSSYDVAKQYGNEVRGLAAKYNPALNAVYQYQQAQLELNRAVALGVLSQQQADAALERTAAQIRQTAAASTQLAAAQKTTGHHTANVFAQLNDIGMMLAAGQNPFQLALQQGTSLTQVWASMGAEGRTLRGVAGVLRGAIGSMISPMSLLTLGVIAGTAALVQWVFAADDAETKTDELKKRVDEFASSVSAVNTIAKNYSNDGLQSLKDKYGEVNAEILILLNRQREFAVAQALEDGRNAVRALGDEYRALNGSIDLYAKTGRGDLGVITKELNLSRDQVVALGRAYKDALNAQTPAQMSDAIARMNTILNQSNIRLDDTARKLVDAEDAARQLSASAPAASWMNAAISGVDTLIGRLREAAREALALSLDAAGNPIIPGVGGVRPRPAPPGEGGIDWGLPPASKGGGGVGSVSELNTFIETLKTRDQVQLEWYEKHKAMVLAADASEFAAIGGKNVALETLELQHQEKMYSIRESYRELERTAQRSMYSELAGLFGAFAGESKIAAIAQLGINTALRVAEIQQNTAAASMRAMAELGPIAGPPAAAKIMAMGKAQMALAVAAAAASGLGGSRGGSGRGASASSATAAAKAQPTQYVTIDVTGDSWARGLVEGVIEQIQQQTKDGRVVFMGNR